MNISKIFDAVNIANLTASAVVKQNLPFVSALKFIVNVDDDLDATDGYIIVHGAMQDVAAAYVELGRVKLQTGISALQVLFPMAWLKVTLDYGSATKGVVTVDVVEASGLMSEQIITREFQLTRPADTTAYAAGDVMANATSDPALPSINIGDAAGIGLMLAQLRVQTNNTAFAGASVRIHFYTEAVTAIADNAAFQMMQANALKRVGYVDLTFDAANGGSTDSVAALNNFDKLLMQTHEGNIHFMPEIRTAKTPTSGQVMTFVFTFIKSE